MAISTEDRFLCDTDRYFFDFKACSPEKGFSQVDTEQDASYLGHWANPFEFKFVSYCEGDLTIKKADTSEEFISMMREFAKWCQDNDDKANIDTMCDEKQKEQWHKLGLKDLLHKSYQ